MKRYLMLGGVVIFLGLVLAGVYSVSQNDIPFAQTSGNNYCWSDYTPNGSAVTSYKELHDIYTNQVGIDVTLDTLKSKDQFRLKDGQIQIRANCGGLNAK